MPCMPIQEFIELSLGMIAMEIKQQAKEIRSGLKEGLRDLERLAALVCLWNRVHAKDMIVFLWQPGT